MTAGRSSPILRPKKKFVLALLLVFVLIFFLYQIMFMSLLDDSQSKILEAQRPKDDHTTMEVDVTNVFDKRGMLRGIRLSDLARYKSDSDGMFTCFSTSTKIPFSWVNDDYCDCPEDGADEPGTNACDNGHFYCATQTKHLTGRGTPHLVPSSRVNDGICDCCDGTDEWNTYNQHRTHCPNVCIRS
ncbi:glucosidase 2 subunit beta [Arctopsyche grandis]|uniref:glucosidase 2 subunit beta n=1 Tax=Arctopsyche grandis TaxID=121162 RepID=UPI00406D70CB